ncbi:MAG: DUF3656 domain-containing protein [Clostridia bacterium]|nr:DUF3656 domain-containing protein [Clostridia bacterium]
MQNGADAVYFGSSFFNARASATNFDLENIEKAIDYAKLRNVKTHLTLNTLIKDSEFSQALDVAAKVYEYGIDAIIVQDLGLAKALIKNFPGLDVHASTQMTFHNLSGVLGAQNLGFRRVVLSREVPIPEIRKIKNASNIELEAFVHGALCISYSGQCLFSSMVGGRSGNRGKCAQACRLPYELLKNSKSIEKGYLLSPKDVSTISILPQLVSSGIDSLKIEGRMKTPEYVATVTSVYRKYLDYIKNESAYNVSPDDSTNLMQVFNRGGFSTGHLLDDSNSGIIYKVKSNNQGIYLGSLSNYAPVSGHIKVKLECPLSIGDTISIESETGNYTVSELMIKNQNLKTANAGDFVTLGRMKGNIHLGDKIYKMSSKQLTDSAKQSFSGKELKKLDLSANLVIQPNKFVTLEVTPLKEPYNDISVFVQSDIMPEDATSSPITKERLIEQISKTGNTQFEFKNIDISLGDNLYLPSIGKLNELRRTALEQLQEKMKNSYKRSFVKVPQPNSVISKKTVSARKIAVLLNSIVPSESYSYLDSANAVYIPLCAFNKQQNILKEICNKYNVYIYLPNIMQNKLENEFKKDIENAFDSFNLKGAVISNISQIDFIPSGKDLIANYTLNVFNSNTVLELSNLGFSRFTASPELTKQEFDELTQASNLPSEVLVYGRLPLMTMQYCLLSHSNHCPQGCPQMCKSDKYELKDRLGFKFIVKNDPNQTITTLYNSKITSIDSKDLQCDFIRVSFLDESENKKNEIIQAIIAGQKLEGENYTNGNYSRIV